MCVITFVSFAVLINESASIVCKPSIALRQRCPLSPLLFSLEVEGLCKLIKEAKRLGALKGVKIGRVLFLSQQNCLWMMFFSFLMELLAKQGRCKKLWSYTIRPLIELWSHLIKKTL